MVYTRRVLVPLLPLVFFIIYSSEANREILVGSNRYYWKIPDSPDQTLNRWAEQNRFKVGDILIWKYDPNADSVLEVTEQDYKSCTTTKAIREHRDGNTKIELNHSGPFYFISGVQANCEKQEKLVVVVLSPNHWKTNNSLLPTPAPGPGPTGGTASTPETGVLGALVVLGTLLGVVLM